MAQSGRKQQAAKPAMRKSKKATDENILKQVVRSITDAHQTTDRKLSELADYCIGKKCNEQT